MAAQSPASPMRAMLVGTNTNGTEAGVLTGATHPPVKCDSYPYLTVYVKATAALSAGTLVIEERDQPGDVPGTIATITLSTPFASAGGTFAYHVTPGAFGYISARIGTDAVGGTVIAILRAC